MQLPLSPTNPLRLAVWSGPRNISTAMMRSWGNRADTYPCDEPFYAHYLKETGKDHPGAEEVIANGESDWRAVADWLTGPVPQGKTVFYQKHMTHHLLDHMDRDWFDKVTHVFLIRDPVDMLPSLDAKLEDFGLEDTGLLTQLDIFNYVKAAGNPNPPVIDARDVVSNPEGVLRNLCARLGLPFDPGMLHWPPGRRETDGIWAKYWYQSVEVSTGFMPYTPKTTPLPDHLADLYAACKPAYDQLYACRITG